MYVDKCKYIDVKTIINLQVHLLFLAAGVLEDKAGEKGLARGGGGVTEPMDGWGCAILALEVAPKNLFYKILCLLAISARKTMPH